MKRLHFHCQHSLGLGHLVRSFALAEALARSFEVTLFVGGRIPDSLPRPRGVTLSALPALRMGTGVELVADVAEGDVSALIEQRRALLLDALRAQRPAAVVVELFPFGRKRLAAELLPWIEAARLQGARVYTSVRDILVTRRDPGAHDERVARTLDELFDGVLVHADPRLARLEDSFRPRTRPCTPVHYTGLVTRSGDVALRPRAERVGVLVSAGGGRVGENVLRVALAVQPTLYASGQPMRVVAGPFAGDASWSALSGVEHPGLRFERAVSDLRPALASCAVSVSQCGYNTAAELIATRSPSVVIPFEAPFEDEQLRRAERLEALGLVRVLRAADVTPEKLLDAVRERISCELPDARLDLGGAEHTRALLVRELGGGS